MKAKSQLQCVIAALLLLLLCAGVSAAHTSPLTDHFLVDLHEGGEQEAKQLAKEYGFAGATKVKSSPFYLQPDTVLIYVCAARSARS